MVSASSERGNLHYPLCSRSYSACPSWMRRMCGKLSSHREPVDDRDPTGRSVRQQANRHASGDVSAALSDTYGFPMSACVNAQSRHSREGQGRINASDVIV